MDSLRANLLSVSCLPRISTTELDEMSDIEHVAIGNGAFGGSDIEGKAAMGSGE